MAPHTRRNSLIRIAVAASAVALLLVVFAVFVSERDPAEKVPEVTLTIDAVGREPIVVGPADYVPEDLDPPPTGRPRIVEEPEQGDVALSGDGTVTYRPTEDFDGSDAFAFDLVDDAGRVVLVVRVALSIEISDIETADVVVASEADVDFGEVCVWCDESTSVEITLGEDDVSIGSVALIEDALGHFSLEHDCLGDPGETCEVQVTFAPIRPGRSDAVLEVWAEGSDDPLLISLRGIGECERPDSGMLAILDEAVGFGAEATGGAEGCLVRVTSLDDAGEGTLREAVERDGPAWVVFDVSGDIELDWYVHITADKTIDGRDAEITIRGAGLAIVQTSNVVITNLEIRDTFEDGLQIRGVRAEDIWITHVTIRDIADGYIDITQGATNVTIAWSRFQPSADWPQEKTILIGAADPGDEDERSRVTLHNNHFENTEQRSPLLRAGRVHSFNNLFDGWGIYGSGVSLDGQLLSERNIYVHRGGDHAGRAFTPWDEAVGNDGSSAFIRSVDDSFSGGASGVEANRDEVFEPEYEYEAFDPDEELADEVTERAGPQ